MCLRGHVVADRQAAHVAPPNLGRYSEIYLPPTLFIREEYIGGFDVGKFSNSRLVLWHKGRGLLYGAFSGVKYCKNEVVR